MAGRITSLYVENTNIRLLVTRGKQIEKWANAPLEPGMVSDGVIIDEVKVAEKIKEIFLQAKIVTGKVIAGLSGVNSLYRIISLPELPESVLPEAVKREAGRVIPTPLDEVYLSYQSIPGPKEETRLFLAAFPKNATDALVKTLRRAGLAPDVMDLAPLALCRNQDEPRAVVVNVRLDSLDIIVMVGRVPQVIRSLSLPGETKSIAENLSTITEELDRTVAFYNSGHAEEPLDPTVPVLVCGDLAEEPDAWPLLVGELNCPVAALVSPMGYPLGFPVHEYMVNIGLALKEQAPEKELDNISLINFNALPLIYLPEHYRPTRAFVPIGIVIGISLVGYMGFLARNTTAYTDALQAQLAPIESRLAKQNEEIVKLNEQVAPLEAKIKLPETATGIFKATLIDLEQSRQQLHQDLGQIVDLLPEDATFVGVNHGGRGVIIKATAVIV
ncbi:pilus assembly protein PilM [Chloroflexota bacterium]